MRKRNGDLDFQKWKIIINFFCKKHLRLTETRSFPSGAKVGKRNGGVKGANEREIRQRQGHKAMANATRQTERSKNVDHGLACATRNVEGGDLYRLVGRVRQVWMIEVKGLRIVQW